MNIIDVLIAPWAIQPDKLREIQAIYRAHVLGERADLMAVEARLGRPLQNEPQGYAVERGVAIVPLHGVIAKRANLFSAVSGAASHELFARDMHAAAADPNVRAVLVWGDTPGGTVDGILHSVAAMRAARAVKPVGTWADGLLASAGVWAGSQADRVYSAGATTVVGSVGVYASHVDRSRALEQLGEKTTEIVAGKFKNLLSSNAPLSDAGRAFLQDQVDQLYSLFVGAVAQGRGVPAEQVLNGMADGRIFMGQAAIDVGLVDAFATRDEAIDDLLDRAASASRVSVAVPPKAKAGASPANPVASATTQESAMPGILHPDRVAEPTASIVTALTAEHPAVAAALRAEGAQAERDRITAVRAQSLPGHEALVEQLAMDGKTTGPDAAAAVLAAERSARAAAAKAHANDAPPAAPASAAPATDAGDDKHAQVAKARAYAAEHKVDFVAAMKALGFAA